jgi:hypothetical protein
VNREISFGDFIRDQDVQRDRISFNELAPAIQYDADGHEIPHRPAALDLTRSDVYRLITPYLTVRFSDQFKAVFPLAVYLVLFQLFILSQAVADS